MKVVVDIPNNVFETYRKSSSDTNDGLKESLYGALSAPDSKSNNITVSKLRDSPHNRPLDPWTNYEWEEGDCCPQCGSSKIRVHYIDVVFFTSENNTFKYDEYSPEDGFDPRVLWQCRECYARLKETVPGTYFE